MDHEHVFISLNVGFFHFFAARQLIEFLFSNLEESGILW